MNHYETLGVAKTATQDEIKKAFRKLSSQHHPDKGGDTEKFKSISVANDILSDPQKRAQYDEEIAGGGKQFRFSAHRNPPGMDPDMGNMEDILAHLRRQFGGAHAGFDPFSQFTQAQQRRSPSNPDVRITIQLDLVSTF
jgi:molecular chaperone DnaJ